MQCFEITTFDVLSIYFLKQTVQHNRTNQLSYFAHNTILSKQISPPPQTYLLFAIGIRTSLKCTGQGINIVIER